MRYFHGGVPGLRPGDLLTPHPPNVVDGCEICAAKARGEATVDPVTGRPDRIYITPDRDYARFYASKYPLGDLYTVEPLGDVDKSEEDHFPTYVCASARVLTVYTRTVRLTDRQRSTLMNRWKRADRAVLFTRQ